MSDSRDDYRLERRIIKGAIIFVIIATVLSMMTAPLLLAITVTVIRPPFQPQTGGQPQSQSQIKPSPKAIADIPGLYLQLYQQAGDRFHVPWPILAGIGKEECNHGRLTAIPGCQPGQVNSAGAAGPMQFLINSTWKAYALPGMNNIYNPADAIMAAGHKLAADGATTPAGIRQAILAYNHDSDYVNNVLNDAQEYTEGGQLWNAIGQWQQGLQSATTGAQSAPSSAISSGQNIASGLGTSIGSLKVVPGNLPALPGAALNSVNPFPPGQCTWWVAANRQVYGATGDAWMWWSQTPASQHIDHPEVGAIAVWGPVQGYSSHGHVGIVIAVQPNTFTVSEMNYAGEFVVDQRVSRFPDPALEGFVK